MVGQRPEGQSKILEYLTKDYPGQSILALMYKEA